MLRSKNNPSPLDPEVERYTVTTSSQNSRQPDFRDSVSERDGGICVATNQPRLFCDAAHLIAVSKGDDYINILTEHRFTNHREQAHIDEINDIRNGLLVIPQIHRGLGKFIGFLSFPNEYMTHEDVDIPPADRSYILHDLTPSPVAAHRDAIPLLSSLRIASQNWPPDILFDVVCASAVLKSWGVRDFVSYMNVRWRNKFYGGTLVPMRDGGLNKRQEQRTQASQRRQHRSEDRERCHTQRSDEQAAEPNTLDFLMVVHYLIGLKHQTGRILLSVPNRCNRRCKSGWERLMSLRPVWHRNVMHNANCVITNYFPHRRTLHLDRIVVKNSFCVSRNLRDGFKTMASNRNSVTYSQLSFHRRSIS